MRRRSSSAVVLWAEFVFEERGDSAFLTPKTFLQVSYLVIYIYVFEAMGFKKGPLNLIKVDSLVISRVFIFITPFGVIYIFYTTKW